MTSIDISLVSLLSIAVAALSAVFTFYKPKKSFSLPIPLVKGDRLQITYTETSTEHVQFKREVVLLSTTNLSISLDEIHKRLMNGESIPGLQIIRPTPSEEQERSGPTP